MKVGKTLATAQLKKEKKKPFVIPAFEKIDKKSTECIFLKQQLNSCLIVWNC